MTPIRKFVLKKVPFGLAQAPAHFQQLINEVLKGLLLVFAHLDGILVFSKNSDRLQAADLKLKRNYR